VWVGNGDFGEGSERPGPYEAGTGYKCEVQTLGAECAGEYPSLRSG